MPDDRWEHGSDFAYPGALTEQGGPRLPEGAATWQSGRDALRALVASAPERFRRVLVPSFYCQEVGLAVRKDGAVMHAYPDDPRLATIPTAALDLRPGDLVVVSNTYGLRRRSPLVGEVPAGVTIVEDHTHDPFSDWALSTRAHYAFASLRKWLPVPDGAALWSGGGLAVPEPPPFDAEHAAVALERLSGMLLKARYLGGEAVSKPAFRALSGEGEARISEGAPGAMSPFSRALVDLFPTDTWRRARRENHDRFVVSLGDASGRGVEVMSAVDVGAPFAVTLLFRDPALRDAVRACLVAHCIYPAVLWPIEEEASARLPGVRDEDADLARRVLSLHCDHRYGPLDMDRVASALRRALEEAPR